MAIQQAILHITFLSDKKESCITIYSDNEKNIQILVTCYCYEQVEGMFYVNSHLEKLMFEELRNNCRGGTTTFLPGVKQIANVAALPGIVKVC